jgi:hypothetical protein
MHVWSESDVFDTDDDSNDGTINDVDDDVKIIPEREKGDRIYKQGYVLPRIVACVESGEDFLTYVPGKDTLMPDGSIICLQEPTDKCPNCSGLSWLSINTDLFPHLMS